MFDDAYTLGNGNVNKVHKALSEKFSLAVEKITSNSTTTTS